MKSYQFDYASGRPQMYDLKSRKKRADRIIVALTQHFGKRKLKELDVLDIGSSTGIIDNFLSPYFKSLVGIDIDEKAVKFAKRNFRKSNLKFLQEDAMNLGFKDNSFDVVICAQIYEHVPDASKLFKEIHRVLRHGGVCYLAALNKLWPIEPHYNLLFLSWLPKNIANIYLKLSGKGRIYYETLSTYWELRDMNRKFKVIDNTEKILRDPRKFEYYTKRMKIFLPIISFFSPILKYLTPTFFWILIKED